VVRDALRVHRSPRPHPARGQARITTTDDSGTELVVTGSPATRLRVDCLPDAGSADAVRRTLDRVLWQRIDADGGEVYAVAHRRPRRLRVTAATALGLLDAGVPTVLRTGAPA
jgi:hypothetical protein